MKDASGRNHEPEGTSRGGRFSIERKEEPSVSLGSVIPAGPSPSTEDTINLVALNPYVRLPAAGGREAQQSVLRVLAQVEEVYLRKYGIGGQLGTGSQFSNPLFVPSGINPQFTVVAFDDKRTVLDMDRDNADRPRVLLSLGHSQPGSSEELRNVEGAANLAAAQHLTGVDARRKMFAAHGLTPYTDVPHSIMVDGGNVTESWEIASESRWWGPERSYLVQFHSPTGYHRQNEYMYQTGLWSPSDRHEHFGEWSIQETKNREPYGEKRASGHGSFADFISQHKPRGL